MLFPIVFKEDNSGFLSSFSPTSIYVKFTFSRLKGSYHRIIFMSGNIYLRDKKYFFS